MAIAGAAGKRAQLQHSFLGLGLLEQNTVASSIRATADPATDKNQRVTPLGCYLSRKSSKINFYLLFVCLLHAVGTLRAEDQFELDEPVSDSRVFVATAAMNANGHLKMALGGGKAVGLKLKVTGHFQYRERRLTGSGRDAEALRNSRYYDQAEATISVNGNPTPSRLRTSRKLVVAQGKRVGLSLHCPDGSLTYDELELLKTPGDGLALRALLPGQKVSIGQTWDPDAWVMQMLTGTDAVLKDELQCRLESVEADIAKVTFSGRVEGAILGAATTIEISGHYLFDTNGHYLRHVEFSQTEKRSVGTVSPGIDVVAELILDRIPTNQIGPLNDATIERISLEPTARLLKIRFDSPWNFRFDYSRDWHLFHQTRDAAVLRLLDKGSLVAQCNISPVPSVSPGQHTPEDQFQADISAALGDRLTEITTAQAIPGGTNRFLYQVTAVGEANGRPMHWHYYLHTDPSGQQVALVFAVETQMLERLGDRELRLVNSLEFKKPPIGNANQ